MEKHLNVDDVFFEAINYPEYARDNFYYNKASQSGWRTEVYLRALLVSHDNAQNVMMRKYSAELRYDRSLNPNDVKMTIGEFLKNNDSTIVDLPKLRQLYLALIKASWADHEEPDFKPLQVLSIAERALNFVKGEFRQLMLAKNRVRTTKSKLAIPVYQVVEDGPFFHFIKFKEALREINLSQQNSRVFANMLAPLRDAAMEIVTLWNTEIAQIANPPLNAPDYVPPRVNRLTFTAADLSITHAKDVEMFELRPYMIFTLQNFATLAANIANLISSEILLDNPKMESKEKKDFTSDMLACIRTMQNYEPTSMLEEDYRDLAWLYFTGAGYISEREPKKGNGFIDLKVSHGSTGTKIVEFKMWRNQSRKEVVKQTLDYLTDFEREGYIFIVQHSEKDILNDYRLIVEDQQTGIIGKIITVDTAEHGTYQYYRSEHKHLGKKKTLYHFILPVKSYIDKDNKKQKKN